MRNFFRKNLIFLVLYFGLILIMFSTTKIKKSKLKLKIRCPCFFGETRKIRTLNFSVRSRVFFPIELQSHMAEGDRFELPLLRSKRNILPLDDPPLWGDRWDLNPQPLHPQCNALPIELLPTYVVFPLGIEPRAYRLEVCCYIRLTMETNGPPRGI